MMVQFYRAKIALADESKERKEVTNIEIDGDDQLCEGFSILCLYWALLCILCLFCHVLFVILECYRINKLDKYRETYPK